MQVLTQNKITVLVFIQYLDSLRIADGSPNSQEYCNTQFIQAQLSIMNIEDLIHNLEMSYAYHRFLLLSTARSLNIAAPNDALFDAYQQDYNNVYIQTIGKGNFNVTEGQVDTLLYLSNSCPLINPAVVFGARNILSLVQGNKFYNDRGICDYAGYTYKKQIDRKLEKLKEEIVFKLFPNPSKDRVSITTNKTIEGSIEIIVYDITSRKVLENNIPKLDYEYKFSIHALTHGYYTVLIKNNGAELYKSKLYVME